MLIEILHLSPVCQTFEDDLCDPYFDTLDSLAPPPPKFKNVSYDSIQFDTGDVPFYKLKDLDDWQEASDFGSCKFLSL